MQNLTSPETSVLIRDSLLSRPRPFVERMNVKVSSQDAPWRKSVVVEQSLMPPTRMTSGYIDKTTLVLPLVNADVLAKRVGATSQIDEGSLKEVVHLDPSGTLVGASWDEPLNMLFLMPTDATEVSFLGGS